MSTKRTAADDAEVSALEVLAQRRELNRLAQKRFRERTREAKKAAAEEALKRQQDPVAEAVLSSSSYAASAVAGPSSESFAWLLDPTACNMLPGVDPGLMQPQASAAAPLFESNAPPQHNAPYHDFQQQAARRSLGQGSDAAKWGLRDASTSASAMATSWTSDRTLSRPPPPPQERIQAAPYAAPASHNGLYADPNGSSDSTFNVASLLPPEASPMPTSWYQNLFEQNLQAVDRSAMAAQQQQQQQRQQMASSSNVAPMRGVGSSLNAAMPTRGAVTSVGVGQTSAVGTSSGSGIIGDGSSSLEFIETIGSDANQPNATKGLKRFDYADVLQASRAWRLLNSPTVKGVRSSIEPKPDDNSKKNMTEAAQQLYDSMADQVLQYRKMTPQEFEQWQQPRVVRTKDFTLLQTLDFSKALSRIATTAKQPEIDDISILSDIAASWSLSEMSESGKAIRDSDVSPNASLEREYHTQRWRDIPKNLWPTDAQLKIAHSPWLDFGVVWPEVRDRMLRLLQAGAIDEDELCADLFICGTYAEGEPPFRVWGTDASDPMAWEIGEAFLQKWHFLFDEDIIDRSNWWRKQRKLEPMHIDLTASIIS